MANQATQIPDLYLLLGLQPLEADRATIEAALKQLVQRAHAVKATDPKQAQRLAKILELGKRHLLSADRKSAYDAQWQREFQAEPSAASLPEVWDTRALEPLLPSGDPHAAFDLAGFLDAATSLPESHHEADFVKLQSLLGGGPADDQAADTPPAVPQSAQSNPSQPPPTPGSRTATSPSPENAAMPTAVEVRQPTSFTTSPSTSPRPSKSLAKQLRAKRDRSLLSIVAGVLLSLGAVLGFLFWRMNLPSVERQAAPTVAAAGNNPIAPNKPSNPTAPPAATPRGSGLPKVQGLEGGLTMGEVFGSGAASTAEPSPDQAATPDNPAAGDAPMSVDAMAGDTQPEPPATEPPTTEPPATEPPATEPPATEPPATEPPATEPPATEPMLSDEQKQAWGELMLSIRESLGQQEFAQATEQLSQAAELAKTTPQKTQLARQQAIAKLAQEFHTALVEAIGGLGAGETFKVKSTDVSFVEGSESRIVVRMRGKNDAYDLVDLPVLLAFGLADLRLDSLHSSSLARKAAFALVHPKTNELVLTQARALMDEAAADGVVATDLPEAFNDDFQL